MNLTIKQMETPEEIEGKSFVHWQTWREAYDDLLPEEFQEIPYGNQRNFS